MLLFQCDFAAMGTPCEIQLFADTQAIAEQLAEQVIADVRRLEARYSRYRQDSYLSMLNGIAATGGSISVDAETSALLDYAEACYQASDGLFDITSGILRQAWRPTATSLPEATQLEQLLGRIGWHKLRWEAPMLHFPVPGMEIDFGGIVKEYAVDRAASLCEAAGVHHGFINLGGDLRVIGARPDGSPWQIGIRHPRAKDSLVATLSLGSGALASSGDYERCIVIDGVRYGHILNPRTGWPVQTLASVSVHAPLCVVAGSAATIAMLKETAGPAWLDDMAMANLWVNLAGEIGGSLQRNIA